MSNQFVTVSVKCAECGKVRGDVNHWFEIVVPPESTDAWAATWAGKEVLYAVVPLNPGSPPTLEYEYPVCGEGCLQKLESKILSGKKL